MVFRLYGGWILESGLIYDFVGSVVKERGSLIGFVGFCVDVFRSRVGSKWFFLFLREREFFCGIELRFLCYYLCGL